MKRLHTPIAYSLIVALGCSPLSTVNAYAQSVPSGTTSYDYDAAGKLKAVRAPLDRTTDLGYDALGRVNSQTQPWPGGGMARPIIGTKYDGLDQVTTVTDPRNLTTTYTVDGLGREDSLSSPDTALSKKTYTNTGMVYTYLDARQKKKTYAYDKIDRLSTIIYTSGTSTWFEYDGGATVIPNAIGKLTKISDESGQTIYTYGPFGRLVTKASTIGTGTAARVHTVGYAYGNTGGATGKLVSLTYPSGNRVNYRYDAEGQLTALTLHPGRVDRTTDTTVEIKILNGLTFDPAGAVSEWEWGNSTASAPNKVQRTIDQDGRISAYDLGKVGAGGVRRTVIYDAANRIKAFTHQGAPGSEAVATALNQSFEYDGIDRLKSYTAATTTQVYYYDATGNRTQASFGSGTHVNTIAPTSNRMATGGTSPAKSYTYDAAGNLETDGVITHKYSDRGRRQSTTAGGAAYTYLYNGLDQRVSKTGPANVVTTGVHNYVYDESGQLLGEYDNNRALLQETVYLGSTPIAVLQRNATAQIAVNYVYADHIDTPRVVTRASDNKIVWRWDQTDPFGMAQPNENPSGVGSFAYNPRFPGQLYDKESGLHYNYYRDYDPQTGRYVQSDPIGLAGGINTFAYVEGSPLDATDPYGLQRGPMRLPRRMEAHNRWNDVHTQMKGEYKHWKNKNNLNYDDPLPLSSPPKPWCRMYCPSDSASSCTPPPPGALPRMSITGEMCAEVCVTGPMFVNEPGAPVPDYQPQGGRSASTGDAMRMGSMILGK